MDRDFAPTDFLVLAQRDRDLALLAAPSPDALIGETSLNPDGSGFRFAQLVKVRTLDVYRPNSDEFGYQGIIRQYALGSVDISKSRMRETQLLSGSRLKTETASPNCSKACRD